MLDRASRLLTELANQLLAVFQVVPTDVVLDTSPRSGQIVRGSALRAAASQHTPCHDTPTSVIREAFQ